jgi:hypothetical protein
MSSTLSDLQYRQVMDNLARMSVSPNSLPYFNVATAGKTTIQHANQASAGLGWGLITAAPGTLVALFDKTVLESETLGFQVNHQNTEEWDTSPSLDPIQLLVMQGLYKKALGIARSPAQEHILDKFYPEVVEACPSPESGKPPAKKKVLVLDEDGKTVREVEEQAIQTSVHKLNPDYVAVLREIYDNLEPGWLCITPQQRVPKNACYVANCGDTYVWVTRRHLEQLTNLTILVIDAATRDTSPDLPRNSQNGKPTPGSANSLPLL